MSAYRRCPPTGGICLQEVSAYRSCPLAEVQLYVSHFLCVPFSKPFRSSKRLWNVSEATWGFPQRLESSTFSSNLIHLAISCHSISSPCFVNCSNSTNAYNVIKFTEQLTVVFYTNKVQGSKLQPIWSPMRLAFSLWRLKFSFSRHFGDLNFAWFWSTIKH